MFRQTRSCSVQSTHTFRLVLSLELEIVLSLELENGSSKKVMRERCEVTRERT